MTRDTLTRDTVNGIHRRRLLARRVAAACGAGVLLLGATACGSSDDGTTTTSGTPTEQSDPSTAVRQMPGANGEVAAVDGSTAQVQSQDAGQVAVTWTSATTFTKQVAAALEDVEVGDCVMVAPVQDDAASSDDSTAQPTAVTADSVRISEPTDGSCTPAGVGGPGGGGGPQFQGSVEDLPDGPPEGAPEGAPDGARPQVRGFGGAFGTVKAVSASGFTVTTTVPGENDASTTTDVTVTVAKATTYSTTATGAASDVKVGVCVRADGDSDSTGAVTATRIAVTPAVEGECTGGMVRFSRNADGTDGGADGGSTGGTAS